MGYKSKHVAHRIETIGGRHGGGTPGIRYLYRGVFIECHGYYEGEHCVCWQAIDRDGIGAFAHGWNLMTTKREIDREYEEYSGSFPGYDDDALKRMGVSKEFYLKYKDK